MQAGCGQTCDTAMTGASIRCGEEGWKIAQPFHSCRCWLVGWEVGRLGTKPIGWPLGACRQHRKIGSLLGHAGGRDELCQLCDYSRHGGDRLEDSNHFIRLDTGLEPIATASRTRLQIMAGSAAARIRPDNGYTRHLGDSCCCRWLEWRREADAKIMAGLIVMIAIISAFSQKMPLLTTYSADC